MQTTTITVEDYSLDVSTAELLRLIGAKSTRPELSGDALPAVPALLAQIGEELQGGIYAGPMFNIQTGQFEHKIVAKEVAGESEWSGAAEIACGYEGGGFSDWRLPTKEEGHLLQMYLQPMGKLPKKICWTSAPYGSYTAWALDFEVGNVDGWTRYYEFAVLPLRSIIA